MTARKRKAAKRRRTLKRGLSDLLIKTETVHGTEPAPKGGDAVLRDDLFVEIKCSGPIQGGGGGGGAPLPGFTVHSYGAGGGGGGPQLTRWQRAKRRLREWVETPLTRGEYIAGLVGIGIFVGIATS